MIMKVTDPYAPEKQQRDHHYHSLHAKRIWSSYAQTLALHHHWQTVTVESPWCVSLCTSSWFLADEQYQVEILDKFKHLKYIFKFQEVFVFVYVWPIKCALHSYLLYKSENLLSRSTHRTIQKWAVATSCDYKATYLLVASPCSERLSEIICH